MTSEGRACRLLLQHTLLVLIMLPGPLTITSMTLENCCLQISLFKLMLIHRYHQGPDFCLYCPSPFAGPSSPRQILHESISVNTLDMSHIQGQ